MNVRRLSPSRFARSTRAVSSDVSWSGQPRPIALLLSLSAGRPTVLLLASINSSRRGANGSAESRPGRASRTSSPPRSTYSTVECERVREVPGERGHIEGLERERRCSGGLAAIVMTTSAR